MLSHLELSYSIHTAAQPWASYTTSLCLSFLIYNMRIIGNLPHEVLEIQGGDVSHKCLYGIYNVLGTVDASPGLRTVPAMW